MALMNGLLAEVIDFGLPIRPPAEMAPDGRQSGSYPESGFWDTGRMPQILINVLVSQVDFQLMQALSTK
jgi:hypothetical protein